MPLSDSLLRVGVAAMAAAVTHISLHTAVPDGSGSHQSTAARQPVSWGPASGSGDISITAPVDFTGGAAGGPATHVGLWTAATGGTFHGWLPISGDRVFDAAGSFRLTSLSLDGAS